ncbi:MAG TPA: tRNA epoxyqueuosine(34) reductase QueG [Haloplasmataceae bacterium]
MNGLIIKEYIENQFPCQVGFVKARIFTELRKNLEKYRDINHDLKIIEHNIDKRINPYLIYKDVKTIIVIIFPYMNTSHDIENKSHIVSRSSWGIDYHLVLKDKLQLVSDFLKKEFSKEAVILVDNHPLHERHLAYLAGLGNYGKNTLLINPKYGSFFFISLLLTNLELNDEEYDTPCLTDLCQDCNLCLKVCPTKAISENRFIEVKKCMSYLTQMKEVIPKEYLNKFTKFTFGCDLCQLACVYNTKDEYQILDEFKPLGNEVIQVKDLTHLSNKAFKEKYKTLAASFRGKNVLLRNALLVSSNRYCLSDLESIEKISVDDIDYLQQAISYAKDRLKKGE